MGIIELRQRSIPDRLAYLAGKIREGADREAVALALDVLAEEMTEPSPVRFDTTGDGGALRAVREFTSESGTYTIRYVPRDGVLIWTDRDYGRAACPVTEWLCVYCHVIFPPVEGARLTAPCPRCGSAMIPTSSSLRALEDMRTEIEVLRAAHRIASDGKAGA
jgi:hypothetical protein